MGGKIAPEAEEETDHFGIQEASVGKESGCVQSILNDDSNSQKIP